MEAIPVNTPLLLVKWTNTNSPNGGSIKVKDTCPRLVVELRIPEGTTTHICIHVH